MFQRGSEWRRWDLHVHTPETKKNDLYSGNSIEEKWDKFYEAIEKYIGDAEDERKAISVIGITDYLCVENYKRVIAENRLPKSVLAVFPNVEMRIIPTGTRSPVNIHFIFNPSIVDKLESRFFSNLTIEVGQRTFNGLKSSLIDLGKQEGHPNTDEEAYKIGIEKFVPSFSDIIKVFRSDSELRENTLIGVSNKSTDGASGIDRGERGDQLSTVRNAIYKNCDFIFSANESDVKYFLGKGVDSEEIVKENCGSLKPCLHGSDAHELDKLFEPDNERYCWIKADPTFNGLKQVIYEPQARARINSLKPEEKADYQVIDKVYINNDDFSDKPILFNDKLTCIIGGKSTGKSLLLQNMARTIDRKQVEEKLQLSGVNTKILDDMQVHWRDGDMSVTGENDQKHKIVYIPQTYLNRLTDATEESTEIDDIIQEIILLDDECKKAFDLMKDKLREYKPTLDKKIYDLVIIYDEMVQIEKDRALIGTEEGIRKEIDKNKKQKDKISKELSISEEDLQKYDQAVKNIADCELAINKCEVDMKLMELVHSLVLPKEMNLEFSEEILTNISNIQTQAILAADTVWKQEKEKIITSLTNQIKLLQEKKAEAQIVRDSLNKKVLENEAIEKLSEQIKTEEEKLNLVIGANRKYKAKKQQYDEAIDEIAKALNYYKEIHNNFAQIVNANTSVKSDGLKFSVGAIFRTDAFCTMIRMAVNNNSLKKFSISFDENFNETKLTQDVIKKFINEILAGEIKLLKNKTIENVLREFLSDWYITSYDVQMDDDNINQMSPGKKALVLLKMLISLADSKCPILIDQPEDDLDNRSIFEELIPFIREKKIVRQIIIVTHNANVVLGGDAEEIIVANQEGNNTPNEEFRFEYRSGAIEDNISKMDAKGNVKRGVLNTKGIQQHICDILEGGEKAFDLRKHKYCI